MRTSLRSARRSIVAVAAACVLVGAMGFPAQASGQAGSADPTVVETAAGQVRGVVTEDRRTFAGIPYAAPPVGELRWQPPQPAASWQGVRDATSPGSRCPQAGASGTSEDCLFLNVTTPPVSAGTHLPVMVWIHGGSWTTGAGSNYGATRLLQSGAGPVLLVTLNYRLGALGFLAHPALDQGEAKSGSFAFADQTAALRWVRTNIAAFGGDPDNVTLFGESAGGDSVCAQLAAPASAGLFERAIIQSASCIPSSWWNTQEESERLGLEAAASLGCSDPATAAACLRKVPADDLVKAMSASQIALTPTYGGDVLPEEPGVAVSTGHFNRVPVMHTGTLDEHRLFVAAREVATGKPLTEADYATEVRAEFGDDAARLLARYPTSAYGSPSLAMAAMFTDGTWSCDGLRTEQTLARFVPTFAGEFADRDAPRYPGTESVSFPLGAAHASELQYLFDGPSFPDRLNAAQAQLSQEMARYWVRFATTGNPSGTGSPIWPGSAPSSVHAQSFTPGADGIRLVDLKAEHQCGFWATYDTTSAEKKP